MAVINAWKQHKQHVKNRILPYFVGSGAQIAKPCPAIVLFYKTNTQQDTIRYYPPHIHIKMPIQHLLPAPTRRCTKLIAKISLSILLSCGLIKTIGNRNLLRSLNIQR